MRVLKGTNLSRPQLQEAAINLLSLGNSITDTSRILGVSTYLVRCLAKGAEMQVDIINMPRLAKDFLHKPKESD